MNANKQAPVHGGLATFLASDGLRLNGFLVGRPGSRGCIVYVHGMTGNFYSSLVSREIAKAVGREGISTFMINTRGHDIESGGHIVSGRDQKRVRIGTRVERFEDSIKDLEGALKYLRSIGYREFVLAGHSTGCQKILYYQFKKSDRSIKGLVFLAPDDDYNLNRKELGRRWAGLVRKAKSLSKARKGDVYVPGMPFSPQRFLSVADLGRVESRLFDYDGRLSEFRKVRTPMYVVFGTRDEGAVKPVKKYIEILREANRSTCFDSLIIKGARHSFRKHEAEVVKGVSAWIKGIW